MKKYCVFLTFIVLMFFIGCSKDEVKPSEDSLLATNAVNTAKELGRAYEEKDTGGIRRYVDADLASSIVDRLDFDKAELTFTARFVNIRNDRVTVNLNWQRKQWFRDQRELENSGVADLVFDTDTMTLVQIKGDNPFYQSSLR